MVAAAQLDVLHVLPSRHLKGLLDMITAPGLTGAHVGQESAVWDSDCSCTQHMSHQQSHQHVIKHNTKLFKLAQYVQPAQCVQAVLEAD